MIFKKLLFMTLVLADSAKSQNFGPGLTCINSAQRYTDGSFAEFSCALAVAFPHLLGSALWDGEQGFTINENSVICPVRGKSGKSEELIFPDYCVHQAPGDVDVRSSNENLAFISENIAVFAKLAMEGNSTVRATQQNEDFHLCEDVTVCVEQGSRFRFFSDNSRSNFLEGLAKLEEGAPEYPVKARKTTQVPKQPRSLAA